MLTDEQRAEVTQVDRDAAIVVVQPFQTFRDTKGWNAGDYDHLDTTQAFARHRIAAEAAATERAARICDEVAKIDGAVGVALAAKRIRETLP